MQWDSERGWNVSNYRWVSLSFPVSEREEPKALSFQVLRFLHEIKITVLTLEDKDKNVSTKGNEDFEFFWGNDEH